MKLNKLFTQQGENIWLRPQPLCIVKFVFFWILCLTPFLSLKAQSGPVLRIALLPAYGWGEPKGINGSGKTIQPYSYGFGGRVEYIFENRFTLGGLFMGYIGETANIVSPDDVPLTLSTQMRHGGLELGYEISTNSGYVFHPYLGFGVGEPVGNFSAELTGINGLGTVSAMGVRPYLSFGIGTLTTVSSFWFLGIEVSYVALTDYQNANSFVIRGIIGINYY